MSSINGIGATRQAQEHLSALAAAIDGLTECDLTGLPDSELTAVMQQVAKSLRRAAAVAGTG